MPIALSAKRMLLEDRTTHQTPIPHKDLLELHALFSKSLAWMEARRYMVEQRDHPGKSQPSYS
jgi:hypothetical protein